MNNNNSNSNIKQYNPPPIATKTTNTLEYQLYDIYDDIYNYSTTTLYNITLFTITTSTTYYIYKYVKYKLYKNKPTHRYVDSDDDYIASYHNNQQQQQPNNNNNNNVQKNDINQQLIEQQQQQSIIDETELLQLIQQCNDILNDLGSINDNTCIYLHNTILELDNKQYNIQTYILCVQYLILYHTYANNNIDNQVTYQEQYNIELQTRNTLYKAIQLLEYNTNSNNNNDNTDDDNIQHQIDILLLDIYIKLRQYNNVHTIYTKLLDYDNNPLTGGTYEDMLIILTSSVYIGQWQSLYNYSNKIIEIRDTLIDFHIHSENNSTIPDYESLYYISNKYNNLTQQQINKLQYKQYNIIEFSLLYKYVECIDDNRRNQVNSLLHQEFNDNQQQYKQIDISNDILTLYGGYAYMISKHDTQPCNMYGPMYDNILHLIGYRNIYLDNTDRVNKQTEEYICKLYNNNNINDNINNNNNYLVYTGQYKLTHELYSEHYDDSSDIDNPIRQLIQPPLVCVFDITIKLKQIQL